MIRGRVGPRRGWRLLLPLPLPLLAAACGGLSEDDMPDANRARTVEAQSAQPVRTVAASQVQGTPMAERVATIGLLNKRNGLTRDLTMKPGQALRVGDAIVRLRACETTAPWENIPETGAFLQLDVRSNADNQWRRAFSGWLFKERPERNVVQHPIYDVWVKNCAMEWPEFGPDTVRSGEGARTRSGAAAPASGANASAAGSAPAPASSAAGAPSGTPSSAGASSEQ